MTRMFEYWLETDLKNLPEVKHLGGQVFSQDSNANKIGVEVFYNGEPITLTGSIKANVIRADGTTLEVTGEKSGNRAWVILPAEAYAVVGHIGIYIKRISGSEISTLGGVESYVYKTR